MPTNTQTMLGIVRDRLDIAAARATQTPIVMMENREIIAGKAEMFWTARELKEGVMSQNTLKRVMSQCQYWVYKTLNSTQELTFDDLADRLEWELNDLQCGQYWPTGVQAFRPFLNFPDGSQIPGIRKVQLNAERALIWALVVEFNIQVDEIRP